MSKANLLLLSIVFAIFILPVALAAQNTISSISADVDCGMTILDSTQTTTNPGIETNITYRTRINITGAEHMNITEFFFNLPDNSSTSVTTDFQIEYESDFKNATSFHAGDYNYVNFSGLDAFASFNSTANESVFNITWKLDQPIGSTKISEPISGRAYTATWNVTSSATNTTIVNASLIVTPDFWHTRIGTPTTVQFNGTSKGYSANLTSIEVWTSLNVSNQNMIRYGDGTGAGTLSVIYNGPTVSKSGGKSSTTLSATPSEVSYWLQPKVMLMILLGIIIAGVLVSIVFYLVKK